MKRITFPELSTTKPFLFFGVPKSILRSISFVSGSRRRTKVWLAELDLLKIAIQRHLGSAKSLKPLPFARKKFLRFASLDAGVLALSSAMVKSDQVSHNESAASFAVATRQTN